MASGLARGRSAAGFSDWGSACNSDRVELLTGRLINDSTAESFELGEVSSIGRTLDSTVVISDPRVSRRHALIRWQEDRYWFFDFGSSNGSYLNGKRVTTARQLRPGDVVRIAEHAFVFEARGEGSPNHDQPATDVTIVEVRSKDVILLVSDIRGFTALSEKLNPDQLAPIIGSWYSQTERILNENGAMLDKFMGDGLLAYWMETSTESRLAALKAAHGMHRACEEVERVHQKVLSEFGLKFRAGAAIHIGPAAYGAFSTQEFTLLGDAVNLVFRLEELTRELDERALVSGEFLEGWSEGQAFCTHLGNRELKGREQAVEVFALQEFPD